MFLKSLVETKIFGGNWTAVNNRTPVATTYVTSDSIDNC